MRLLRLLLAVGSSGLMAFCATTPTPQTIIFGPKSSICYNVLLTDGTRSVSGFKCDYDYGEVNRP